MGLCIIEGGAASNHITIKSGEALLIALGSSNDYLASYWWDYHNSSFPTNGYMQFSNLDFSNVYSFTL